jgi:DNA-binding SARP family transcriptional activator
MSKGKGKTSLKLLGGFQLTAADGNTLTISRRLVRDVLIYLAMAPRASVPRSRLAGLFWPHLETSRARHNLRQTLVYLSRTLIEANVDILEMDSENVRLNAQTVDIDAWHFEQLASSQHESDLRAADKLYGGPFLADLVPDDSEFGEWTVEVRRRLEATAISVLDRLLERKRSSTPNDTAALAQKLLSLDPYREDVHQILMEAYLAAGKRASAMAQYRACCKMLQEELATEPEETTRAIYNRIIADKAGPEEPDEAEAGPETPELEDTPIGRRAEVDAGRQAIADIKKGREATLLFTGEAGIGKTHLLRFLVGHAKAEGVAVLATRGRRTEQNTPYTVLQRLVACVQETGEARQILLDALENPSPSDVPPIRQVRDWLAHLCRAAPVVLAVDDLEHADSASLEVLCQLADWPTSPVLLLGALDGTTHGGTRALDTLQETDRFRAMPIGPLSRTETIDFGLSLVSEGRGRLRAKAQRLYQVTGGNPRAICEAVQAYTESPAGRPISVPPSVLKEVRETNDRLSVAAREYLRIAAVIGQEIPMELAARAAALESDSEALEELVDCRVLEVAGEQIGFLKPRLRIGLYETLNPGVRRDLHGLVATAIKDCRNDHASVDTPALAHHLQQSGAVEEALTTLLSAVRTELDRGHRATAERYLAQVIAWAKSAPDSTGVESALMDANLLRAETSLGRGDSDVAHFLDEARHFAQRLDADDGLARIHAVEARRLALAEDLQGARANLKVALPLSERARTSPPYETTDNVWHSMDRWFVRLGDLECHDEVQRNLETQVEHAHRFGLRCSEIEHSLRLALLLSVTGNGEKADKYCQVAYETAERVGSAMQMSAVLYCRGFIEMTNGSIETAMESLSNAGRLAHGEGDLLRLYAIEVLSGLVLLRAGQLEAAVERLERARADALDLRTHLYLPLCTAWLAEAKAQLSPSQDTLAFCEAAYELAAAANCHWPATIASRAMARAMLGLGDSSSHEAERAVRFAVTVQRAAGMTIEAATSQLVHARILRRRGHLQEARQLFEEAAAAFVAAGLSAFGEGARRQALALTVPADGD